MSNRKRKLPPHMSVALAEMRELIKQARTHNLKGRAYYFGIGKLWGSIKADPIIDEIGGLIALKPFLPASIPWLNRCLVAFDGHETGDLQRGERHAQQTHYHPRNSEEPYLAAELTELWRGKKPPRQRKSLPFAMITGRICVRTEAERFPHGSALLGDCHDLIHDLPGATIDAIFNDPPFGIWGDLSHGHVGKIGHTWDKALDWDRLWPEFWRVARPAATIAIFAAQPLASVLIAAQLKSFLYCLYWYRKATNIYGPKHARPMINIEPIALFSRAGHRERTYHPQMIDLGEVIERLREPWRRRLFQPLITELEAFPRRLSYRAISPIDLIIAERTSLDAPQIQHGQKRVEVMRYLVRTFSDPGDVILDPTAGSMTTAVAAALEGRRFICFEQHRPHFVLGTRRLRHLYATNSLPKP